MIEMLGHKIVGFYIFFFFCLHKVIGVVSREYIPKGTRFGPLVGESYTAENVPKDANRKYFWRVSCFFFFFRSFTFSKGGANEIQERKKTHTHTQANRSLPVPLTYFLRGMMGARLM